MLSFRTTSPMSNFPPLCEERRILDVDTHRSNDVLDRGVVEKDLNSADGADRTIDHHAFVRYVEWVE